MYEQGMIDVWRHTTSLCEPWRDTIDIVVNSEYPNYPKVCAIYSSSASPMSPSSFCGQIHRRRFSPHYFKHLSISELFTKIQVW